MKKLKLTFNRTKKKIVWLQEINFLENIGGDEQTVGPHIHLTFRVRKEEAYFASGS